MTCFFLVKRLWHFLHRLKVIQLYWYASVLLNFFLKYWYYFNSKDKLHTNIYIENTKVWVSTTPRIINSPVIGEQNKNTNQP